MFPGLFIQPSVWLRTPTPHALATTTPLPIVPTLPGFRPSYKGSHLKWHCKAPNMIGEEHNVVCVKARKKKKSEAL